MNISSFGGYSPNSQMSMAPNVPNISTGNPMIDQLISMLLSGSNIAPRPLPGQSIMDGYLARQRSMDFLNSMRGSFSSQLMAQKLGGINPNSGYASLLSTFVGQPDGVMNSTIMRAFNGGNPVRAHMSLMANMTGMNNYMGTGRIGNASMRDVSNAMSGFTNSLYDQNSRGEPTRFNFEKSAGFELQDLTSSYTSAQDVGLFNNRKYHEQEKLAAYARHGITPNEYRSHKWRQENGGRLRAAENEGAERTSSIFAENSAYALRATADLTGATSANQAVAHMNRLFSISGIDQEGNAFVKGSTMNLGDKGDSQYAEKLQREVKAVARNAGIGIEGLLGIVEESKALAAKYPGLASMGGAGVMSNTMKVFKNTMIAAGVAGSDQVRRDGGITHVTNQAMALDAENRAEPISQGIVALYGHIASSTDYSQAAKQQLYGQLRDWEKNGKGNAQDNNDRIARMAKAMGVSGGMVSAAMQNQFSRDRGYELMEQNQRLGLAADIEGNAGANIKNNIISGYQNKWYDIQIKNGSFKGFRNGAEVTAAFDRAIQNQSASGKTTAQIASEFQMDNVLKMAMPNATKEERDRLLQNRIRQSRLSGPNAIADAAAWDAAVKSNVDTETEMAHRSGSLYAPLAGVLAQQLMSAPQGSEWRKLVGAISSEPMYQRAFTIGSKATDLAENIESAAMQESLFMEEHGGVDPDNVRKNLRDQGVGDGQMTSVEARRAAYTTAGREAYLKAGKSGLTLNKLLSLKAMPDSAEKQARLKELGINSADLDSAVAFVNGTGLGSKEQQGKFGDSKLTASLLGNQLLAASGANAISRSANSVIAGQEASGWQKAQDMLAEMDKQGGNQAAMAAHIRGEMAAGGVTDAHSFAQLGSGPHVDEATRKALGITGANVDVGSLMSKYGGLSGRDSKLKELGKYGANIIDPKTGKVDQAKLQANLEQLKKDAGLDVAESALSGSGRLANHANVNHQSIAANIAKRDELMKAHGMGGKDELMNKLEETLGSTSGKLTGMDESLKTIAMALEKLAQVGGA